MAIQPDIYSQIIQQQYEAGRTYATVITGFASAPFINHLLYKYENLNLDIIIGMASKYPPYIWDHKEYIRMAEDTGRLRVRYYNSFPPLHANVILWRNSVGEYDLVFTGTANLTWNGFKNYREIMTKADFSSISYIFPDEDSLKDFRDHDIMSQIKMLYYRPESSATVVDIGSLRNRLESCQKVELYLTQKKDGQVQEKSGLNWGQREGREPNQAYIPISSDVHKSMPDFFPDLSVEFMLITDDGEQFVCTVAQQNRKAIHTKDNSQLGKYFRKRLGIPLGEKVERKHLDQYGTDKLLIYKISDDAFYMDFTPNQALESQN